MVEIKWTFKHAFGKKVDFLSAFWENVVILRAFWEKVDSFACFVGESGLFVIKTFPKLWTILDTLGPLGGGAFASLAHPLATGLQCKLAEVVWVYSV